MEHAERLLLYTTVHEVKPKLALECGTWQGMGSTLFISQAIWENRADGVKGTLHSFELDADLIENAFKAYSASFQELIHDSVVKFHDTDFLGAILNDDYKGATFCLLDGPDDSAFTFKCFNRMKELMSTGSVLILHDWNSQKCEIVRSLANPDNGWEIVQILDTKTGMCKLVRI